MMYGIMKEKGVKLSSIVRALKEETTPKKVEDRLSRMLSAKGLEAGQHGVIAAEAAGGAALTRQRPRGRPRHRSSSSSG